MTSEPGRIVGFYIEVSKVKVEGSPFVPFSEEEQVLNQMCVAEYLRRSDLQVATDVGAVQTLRDVLAIGSHGRVFPALSRLEIVQGLEIRCESGTCRECGSHTPEECRRDALCAPYGAGMFDTARACLIPADAPFCIPFDTPCSGADGFAVDPDGRCWMLGQSCPVGARWSGWRIDPSCAAPASGLIPTCLEADGGGG